MAADGQGVVHDVVVVGGGLVGACLAIALDRAGARVALVDAAPPGALPDVFDQRNLSFGEAAVNALQALGVMRHLRNPPAPIRRIHASRRGDFGRVVLDAADHGRSAFGQVVVARLSDEVTVKRFKRRGHAVQLLPENPDFEPIEVDLRNEALVIEGIAVGIIRNGRGL